MQHFQPPLLNAERPVRASLDDVIGAGPWRGGAVGETEPADFNKAWRSRADGAFVPSILLAIGLAVAAFVLPFAKSGPSGDGASSGRNAQVMGEAAH